jgi:ferredoxin-NADP reductase
MDFIVRINEIQEVTHDVKCFRLAKPEGYRFVPGEATDLSIRLPDWEQEKRPFTFTSLNEDPFLEFTIKRYSDHPGVTNRLHQLAVGDELVIGEPWGAIHYQGPGIFIAGGAGITPFIAIFRQLFKEGKIEDNRLFFSNKTSGDIIYKNEFDRMLGGRAVYVLTQDKTAGKTYINEEFLDREIADLEVPFYICGPDKMVHDIQEILKKKGASADALIFEK